ncbi:MAG TPA: hypothetical protein VJM80_11785 [bacterium]|nr:hypothetical protein [bacterium]
MRRHFHAARIGWGIFQSRGHGCPCCGCPGFVVTKEQALKDLELHKEHLEAELAEVEEEIKEIQESE